MRRRLPLNPTTWPAAPTGPRVLIEHHDDAIASAVGNLLTEEGFVVAVCSGPDDRRTPCPLVGFGTCQAAADADLVFYGLHVSDERDRDVLRSLRVHFEQTPVIVEMPVARIPLYRDELTGCFPVARPVTGRPCCAPSTRRCVDGPRCSAAGGDGDPQPDDRRRPRRCRAHPGPQDAGHGEPP
ncbi:MAG: hypothetical protein R2695_06235 [Acidimicrobiales bacterium]